MKIKLILEMILIGGTTVANTTAITFVLALSNHYFYIFDGNEANKIFEAPLLHW